MRNVLSSLFFIVIFVGLGAMAFAAAPRGREAVQSEVVVQPSAPIAEIAGPEEALATTEKWYAVALPLEADLANADEVAYYVDPAPSTVKKVAQWNAGLQAWQIRIVGGFGTPFAISVGTPLLIQLDSTSPTNVSFVGDVPAIGSINYSLIQNAWNYIMIPLDQSDEFAMTADGLGNDIGGVQKVARWNAEVQAWQVRIVNGFGSPFDVSPGYPYLIYTTESTPASWPN